MAWRGDIITIDLCTITCKTGTWKEYSRSNSCKHLNHNIVMCLDEWNSWECAPYSAETINIPLHTYRLIQMTMCNIHIHILSTHSVLLDILTVINTHYTPYVHILHYVHIYTYIGIGCCGDVFLRAAERTVCGTGGWSHWWSSGLSLYTAWCRYPGGREAHLQQCGGQFAQPFAELCGCQRCCFQTRRWCSRSGCSPQCRCRMIWGCWGSFQTSSAVSGRRGVDVTSSALHLCEWIMWDPQWCECRRT